MVDRMPLPQDPISFQEMLDAGRLELLRDPALEETRRVLSMLEGAAGAP